MISPVPPGVIIVKGGLAGSTKSRNYEPYKGKRGTGAESTSLRLTLSVDYDTIYIT
jgi:hypothetical protein